ncbi:ATP-binding cassette domain-containing protein [Acinetobacter gerneri]|uniref:ATP-binding cassette domain-containing protein n=1 Tax=Acinetobacter gerneri TaxID=202952 RepID=A0AAW8JDW6_9GAMM|nr:ATP-binding cassette domain-containing protein [Acinetobacter gerneri]MDQ9009806.1 ATP-binding cassette domain-containing protein [Acinetobacter gerneri]MDQ9013952.1 ATP-binding cassette domain-containing protein [Acinetobacter gerneri]MDQ9023593.1 ATP-binding cassette domain-containing protein [Acinetobacter gerneri]MDQ9052469.1 ATP-binding cassette domain-containing protein [Acinetobacter gerneri]MDQ9060022.1 ATP-binding cassette domain-containing protein [Acinetobacter gerneri]
MSELINVVEAQNLSCHFKAEQKNQSDIIAIDQLNLTLKSGQISALVGPDGAGKSTFLRMIAGLYAPTSGSLQVLGIDVEKHPQQIQDQISYMPQKFGLYEDLSVQENLDLYADLHGISHEMRQERFARLLSITDLTRFTDRLVGNLSGGMKQKLGLACTLVRSPQLLLLDEPSVGVDPLSRRDLWKIIEELVKQEQLSVIISTAYMDEAERCDQVFVMYQGRILQQRTPLEITSLVQGLTWQIKPPAQMKSRVLQAHLLEQTQDIIDAVPKGDLVRFISFEPNIEKIKHIFPENTQAVSREAELEDAFMMLLHKANTEANTGTQLYENNQSSSVDTDVDTNEPVIVVKDLVRKFGEFTAVANTSFEVKRGEIFGLLGPNGAGKTTTFRMLCGLLPATSGFLEVAGVNLRHTRAKARGKIGYVSQKFALYSNLSVRENLTFFAGAYGLYGKTLKQHIAKVLKQFNLDENANSGDLPGGYKQRLSMAVALVHEPEIVFLDEPTSGIDPVARRSFWYSIGELANKGITVIVTTHFMEEAEYCDRIAIQDAGKMLALGSPKQVREQAGLNNVHDMNSAFIAIVEQAREKSRQNKVEVG